MPENDFFHLNAWVYMIALIEDGDTASILSRRCHHCNYNNDKSYAPETYTYIARVLTALIKEKFIISKPKGRINILSLTEKGKTIRHHVKELSQLTGYDFNDSSRKRR